MLFSTKFVCGDEYPVLFKQNRYFCKLNSVGLICAEFQLLKNRQGMKILIAAATTFEVEDLVDYFEIKQVISDRLLQCQYHDHEVDVLYTGVGMLLSAYWTGRTLAKEQYDYALNLGIAGSYSKDYNIGDVVDVISEQIADFGAEDGDRFITMEEMKFLDGEGYPFIGGKLINDYKCRNSIIEYLPKVHGITSNTVHGSARSIRLMKDLYQPDVESMEGAAFIYSCLMEDVRFAQVRAISNFVEIRKREDWNIGKAVKSLTRVGLDILDNF
jgi:futalosine hydrolase